MTDKSFTKPSVVQDFVLALGAADVSHDGPHAGTKLIEPSEAWLRQVVVDLVSRFLPQVSPGKDINITIRMESEL